MISAMVAVIIAAVSYLVGVLDIENLAKVFWLVVAVAVLVAGWFTIGLLRIKSTQQRHLSAEAWLAARTDVTRSD